MVAEVSETTTKDDGTLKLKLHDKLRALEGIRKMLGFDAPVRQEHTVREETDDSLFDEFTIEELRDFRNAHRKLAASRAEAQGEEEEARDRLGLSASEVSQREEGQA